MSEIQSLPVRDGEEPWTPEEVAAQRTELLAEIERMEKRIAVAEAELEALMQEGADVGGRDPADVGASNFEREQEMSLAHGVRELLDQSRLALQLFDEGQYGLCEVCEQPIGKARLQVFPRATLCMACKQREERR
ncbi:MAG: TraR/DksA C4-type zinc finger protein [Propionibacteriaceae bacterium]|nr:TraR/DksA C4-type zinc finger protein [Propionibacteriaceae bacterium]MDO4718909.1 TraR/DksA C4-type zinc finger protein [Propionibacteriaceae bacterium]